MRTEAETIETTDYQEMRVAIFRAKQHLEEAYGALASAEAFAETGTTGSMRDAAISELKKARHIAFMAARHAGEAEMRSR